MHDPRPVLNGGDAGTSPTESLGGGGADAVFAGHVDGGGAR